MARFYYKARDRQGLLTEGSCLATNAYFARKDLNKRNLIVLELSRFNYKSILTAFDRLIKNFTQRVTLDEQMILMSQIEIGISVGIPIMKMFDLLQKDIKNAYLKAAIIDVAASVTEGSTLHEAFGRHPKIFNSTIVGLIKTGEMSGKIESTLGRITQMIEQQAENRAKVKSAVFYPKIVVFVLVVVSGGVVYFIIPKLKGMLSALNTDLPPITRFVVGASDFVVSYWYLVLAFGIASYLLFQKIVTSENGKKRIDQIKLNVPVFGTLFTYLEMNNLCVILELLISSGIPLYDALGTLKDSQENEVFRKELAHLQAEISKGGSLTSGMENSTVFPSTFKSLLSMGEESGQMEAVLKRLARHYQVEVDYRLDNLSKLIEPILLVIIFGMVLILALAVLLPIWKMNSAIQGIPR